VPGLIAVLPQRGKHRYPKTKARPKSALRLEFGAQHYADFINMNPI
jgi:hypothetical protein